MVTVAVAELNTPVVSVAVKVIVPKLAASDPTLWTVNYLDASPFANVRST
jgi:hypothetical protein